MTTFLKESQKRTTSELPNERVEGTFRTIESPMPMPRHLSRVDSSALEDDVTAATSTTVTDFELISARYFFCTIYEFY